MFVDLQEVHGFTVFIFLVWFSSYLRKPTSRVQSPKEIIKGLSLWAMWSPKCHRLISQGFFLAPSLHPQIFGFIDSNVSAMQNTSNFAGFNQPKSGWQLDAFQDVAEALRSNRDTLEKDLLYITSIIRWNLRSWVVCFNLSNCTSPSTCVVASRGMEILPPKPAPGRLQKHPMLRCCDTRSFGLLAWAVETVVQMAGPPVVRMQEKASMGCWKCEGTIGFMAFSPTLNSRGASILLHGQPVEWDQRCLPRGCWIDREDGMAAGSNNKVDIV